MTATLSKARRGNGTTVSVGGSTVGELLTIGGMEFSRDTVDVTSMDSSDWKQVIAGLKSGGELAITGNYVQGDAGQLALGTAFASNTPTAIVITFPKLSTESAGAKLEFSGVVTKYQPVGEANHTDQLKYGATFTVTGQPEFTDGVAS